MEIEDRKLDKLEEEVTRPFEDLTLVTINDVEDETHPLTAAIKPWYRESDQRNLMIMGVMVLVFAIAEFVVGIITGSLALLADASHMLSDQFAITIGFAAAQIKKREKSDRFSYGWERAEVIGALINGVFLLSASLFILLEAVERFIDPPDITQPVVLIITASGGLLVNIIGLFMFMGHAGSGHSHSHGHSHGGGHSHDDSEKKKKKEGHSHAHKEGKKDKPEKKKNVNMHGVFLHVLGDCLGSIGAILSGLGIWKLPWSGRFYLDPAISVLITGIILKSSIPLIKTCVKILMQSVPDGIDLTKIEEQIMAMAGVVSVHELHVWQLADTKVIGTVHIAARSDVDFFNLAVNIKKILHQNGVHSSTIQPEFVTDIKEDQEPRCSLACESGKCASSMCCTPRRSRKSSSAPLVEKRKKGEDADLP